MIFIGKIVNTKGLKGEVKILSSSDFKDERFQKNKLIYIKEENNYKKLEIETSYEYKNFQIVKFKNLDSINSVEIYKGQKIYGPKLDRNILKNGEYYFSDLVNLKVYEENKAIGSVKEVLDYGNKTYLRINKTNNKMILFPFNFEFIKNVDLKNDIITVRSIEGLLDD